MSSGLVSFRSTAPQTTATGAPVQQPATLSPPVNLAATISLAPASSGAATRCVFNDFSVSQSSAEDVLTEVGEVTFLITWIGNLMNEIMHSLVLAGSSLSTGAIVGIAIGAAAAVIAILSLAVYLKNRNFGRKMSSQRSMSGGTVGGSAYYNQACAPLSSTSNGPRQPENQMTERLLQLLLQSYASSEFMGLNEIKLPINSDESGSLSSSKFGQSAPSPMP